MANKNLTADRIREILHYDPVTGDFTWLNHRRGKKSICGMKAGFVNSRGYRIISIDNRPVQAHRAAWLYVNGVWPSGLIDHRNGIKTDNRIGNLREATNVVNCQNVTVATVRSQAGIRGVSKYFNRWQARICVAGKKIYLGAFDSPQAASAAYIDAKRRMHEGFCE